MANPASEYFNDLRHNATSNSLLPVELVHDIVCYVLSSYYWAYFIEGEIILKGSYKESNNPADGIHCRTTQEWDPVVAMSGIDVIFRDQTLRVASKILGIPRAVDGRSVVKIVSTRP